MSTISRDPVPTPLSFIRRHPRRWGFVAFNLVVGVLLVAWGLRTTALAVSDPTQLPQLAIDYAGGALLVVLWIGMWVSWAVFVAWRHRAD